MSESAGPAAAEEPQRFGDIVATDSGKKFAKPIAASGAMKSECTEILDKLNASVAQMFMDKGRIMGKLVRLDQQKFVAGDPVVSITALQNNTAPGAREHSGCISCVTVTVDLEGDPQVARALIWAHGRSIVSATTWDLKSSAAPAASSASSSSTTAYDTYSCASCKATRTLPTGLVEMGLELGCYPPSGFECPRCKNPFFG